MITCHVRYEIDPDEIEAFARFARRWMELVERHGGTHHGYFLPSVAFNGRGHILGSALGSKQRTLDELRKQIER
jgi:hypothetical protein